MGNSLSSDIEVKFGVPQGSVLGPLFFIIFIYDFPNSVLSKCVGYADDFKFKTVSTNPITLQTDAARICKWCTHEMMKFNINKCTLLNFKGNTNITLNGLQLMQTNKEKHLGITVSQEISWRISWEKAKKAFYTIRRNIAKGTS